MVTMHRKSRVLCGLTSAVWSQRKQDVLHAAAKLGLSMPGLALRYAFGVGLTIGEKFVSALMSWQLSPVKFQAVQKSLQVLPLAEASALSSVHVPGNPATPTLPAPPVALAPPELFVPPAAAPPELVPPVALEPPVAPPELLPPVDDLPPVALTPPELPPPVDFPAVPPVAGEPPVAESSEHPEIEAATTARTSADD